MTDKSATASTVSMTRSRPTLSRAGALERKVPRPSRAISQRQSARRPRGLWCELLIGRWRGSLRPLHLFYLDFEPRVVTLALVPELRIRAGQSQDEHRAIGGFRARGFEEIFESGDLLHEEPAIGPLQ